MKNINRIKGQLLLQDCTGREIIFPNLETPDLPKEGDFAVDANGQPIDGMVLFPELDIYLFKKGKLVEIILDESLIAKFGVLSAKKVNEIKASLSADTKEYLKNSKAEFTKTLKADRESFHKLLGIKQ